MGRGVRSETGENPSSAQKRVEFRILRYGSRFLRSSPVRVESKMIPYRDFLKMEIN